MLPRPTEQVAANVRAEMARQRITQAQLAAVLGRSQQALSSRLSGRVAFSIDEIATVADRLGIPVSALIGEPERAA